MSIIGAMTRPVILSNISFIQNFADSTGSQFIYSLGGAVTMSQASRVSIIDSNFYENSAVEGFGNDLAIPTNDQDAVQILVEKTCFHSPTTNTSLNILIVKQYLIDSISRSGYISYFKVDSGVSIYENVALPSPKDYFSAVLGIFITSGHISLNNVDFKSRYHIFAGNFLNFVSDDEIMKYVSNCSLEISGSIPDAQLTITAVSSVVKVKLRSGPCLGRLNIINGTLIVDRDMCILGKSIITGSSFEVEAMTQDEKPTIEFKDYVFHGAYDQSKYYNRLKIVTADPRLSLSGVNVLISGKMIVAGIYNNISDFMIVSLENDSNLIINRNGHLEVCSDTFIGSSLITNNTSLINMGLISVVNIGTQRTTLVITGSIFNQTTGGQLHVTLDNSFENRPIIYLDDNQYLRGILNASIADGTKLLLYPPQKPTYFDLLLYQSISPDNENSMTVVADQGLKFEKQSSFNPSLDAYNVSLTVSEIACEQVNSYYYIDPNIYTDASSVSNYLCHICLLNSSCGFCTSSGSGMCVLGDACVSGILRDNCCKGGCNGHGTCEASADYASFECSCDFFYSGSECNQLSLYSWLFVAFGVFFFLFILMSLGYYYYYMKQPNRVLEDLLHQLSGDKSRKEVISATHLQRLQQEFILKDVFVKYEEIKVEDKIGEGSFGEVYKASFRGAQVALKKLRNPMFMQLTVNDIEEFRKEAYMMSRLRHPNIVLVMGISLVELEPVRHLSVDMAELAALDEESTGSKKSETKKTLCILTEYLEQGSLADILYGRRRISMEVWTYELVLICAIQAGKGMLYLHSQSPPICHRDLKSSNLVVDNHWVVKVTDFGMSRIVPENSVGEGKDQGPERNSFFSQDLEMTSNLGTTAWCAPEIFTPSEKARYSLPVDVYSFGMVLWELWERKRPYEELPSRFDVIDAIKAGNRPPISESCPTGLMSLIQRCWQYDPARRPKFSYIVRYLKEELARVQRQRVAGASSTVERNFFTDLLSPLSTPNKLTQGGVDDKSASPWHGKLFGASKSSSGRSSLQETLLSPKDGNVDSQELGRTLSKSALQQAPPVGWRDRYVMRFSGWRASSPDMGLPPSLGSSAAKTSANMFSPQQIVHGNVSLSQSADSLGESERRLSEDRNSSAY